MTRCLTLLFSAAFLIQSTVAQQTYIRCETVEDEAERLLYGQAEPKVDFENWIAAQITHRKTKSMGASRAILTIPVIFHIIHNGDNVGSGENLSQAQINSQLDVLNEDFRRTPGTPGFNSNAVGADCEIEFCMAVIDPNGNILSEPGIDRRDMGQSTWQRSTGATNDIQAVLKPQTSWDPTKYLNIWTVNFGGASSNLLGYAQFPSSTLPGMGTNAGAANTDGVVVRATATGRVGNVVSPYNKGRTLTHEVGHCLGLRHIWGDGSDCTATDYCGDTPASDASNSGCPNTNSCTDPAPDPRDMVENYMDYTNDACMNIFTQDQKARMLTVLGVSPRRLSLTTSNVCFIPATISFTGKVIDAATNAGIANANVLMTGAGTYNLTTDANGNFTVASLIAGNYTIYAGKWGYRTNTKAAANYTTTGPTVNIALTKGYYDDFSFDFNWANTSNASTGNWTRAVPIGTIYTANNTSLTCATDADVSTDFTNQAYVTGNGGGQAGTDDVDGGTIILTSPTMDLTTYTDPILKYYRWFFNDGGTGTPDDSFEVVLSSGNQSLVVEKIGFASSSSQWNLKSYRIKNFFPNPGNNIKVSFRTFDTSTGHLVEGGVDLFQVSDSIPPQAAPPVANMGVSTNVICAGNTINYNDLSTNAPTSWKWIFPGGSPSASTNQNPVVTYNSPGSYNAILIAVNSFGADTFTISTPVDVIGVEASFTQSVFATCIGDTVSFQSQSSCNPSTIKWILNGANPSTSTASTAAVVYNQAGLYDVTLIATNSFGSDTLTQSLTIQIFDAPGLIFGASPDTNNTGVGTATIDASSSVGPISYVWSNGQTTPSIQGLTAGTYIVTVTDGNGCTASETVAVGNVLFNSIKDEIDGKVFEIFPNPTHHFVAIKTSEKGLHATLTNSLGQKMMTQTLENPTTYFDLHDQPNGIYVLTVMDKDKMVKNWRIVKQ